MSEQKQFIYPALILGGALLLAALVVGSTWKTVRGFDNALSVTGSAKTQVKSDAVKWMLNIERSVYGRENVSGAYAQIGADRDAVLLMLDKAGIKKEDVILMPPNLSQDNYYDPNRSPGTPIQYHVSQTLTLNSTDVEKITQLAKDLSTLINKGIFVNTVSLEYYYTKLPELRVSLLGDAIKDAQARAGQIAKASGKKVGELKSASSGVVQVLPVNSAEVSDYGTYDTSNVDKDVLVTVRASFVLK